MLFQLNLPIWSKRADPCSSAYFGRINDLMTLSYLPSHVWWQTVFYSLGVSDPACQITVAVAYFFNCACEAVIVKFYYTALNQRGCLKWNCKLIVSRCSSHNLIVVFSAFDTALTLSGKAQYLMFTYCNFTGTQAWSRLVYTKQQRAAPAGGLEVLSTHWSASRQESYY